MAPGPRPRPRPPARRLAPHSQAAPVRLLDATHPVLPLWHYSWRTEAFYVGWICRFIRFHRGRHLRTLGDRDVEQFLSHLAVDGYVAPNTLNYLFAAFAAALRAAGLTKRASCHTLRHRLLGREAVERPADLHEVSRQLVDAGRGRRAGRERGDGDRVLVHMEHEIDRTGSRRSAGRGRRGYRGRPG